MEKYLEIIEVHGREILDSRGNPTVAAVVTVKDKETGRCTKGMAAVPSGASAACRKKYRRENCRCFTGRKCPGTDPYR